MNNQGPVSCALLDNLELLAIRRTPCRIRYRHGNRYHAVAQGVIRDFQIMDGAEYLIFEDNPPIRGQTGVIRLDAITEIEPLDRINNRSQERSP